MWEQLETDMNKTNPKPNICHVSTLGKPKRDQTGFLHMTLAVALTMVWKTQIPVPRSQDCPWPCCGVNRDPGSLWLILGHPCVLENPQRLWQRQGGDAGSCDPLISSSSETLRDCVTQGQT